MTAPTFSQVEHSRNCPECDTLVDKWLASVEPESPVSVTIYTLHEFHAVCSGCNALLRYTRKLADGIEDFDLFVC